MSAFQSKEGFCTSRRPLFGVIYDAPAKAMSRRLGIAPTWPLSGELPSYPSAGRPPRWAGYRKQITIIIVSSHERI